MFDLVIAGIFVFIVYTIFSAWKNKNPEKWARFQRELVENEAKRYADNYEQALRKVPSSEWILMTREEKADVLRSRENLGEEYSRLSMEARKIVVNKYDITPEKATRYKQ